MAQHDYVIDNQSAPSFRADLNSALAAIVSGNSGGSAPTVTFANMLWYDTTNNQIKKRNETDTAWIILGTVDETLSTFTPSGSVSPTIATLAEAQAGTDNTKMMTPLRVADAITARAVPTVAGEIGTYAFARPSTTANYAFGATLAGSSLQPTAAFTSIEDPANATSTATFSMTLGTALSGTWRCMGTHTYRTGDMDPGIAGSEVSYFYGATLWLRIS